MIVRWLGNSALEIRGDKNILIDPEYEYKPVNKPELILVSHEHDDHVNPEKVNSFPRAQLYAPLSVFEKYNLEGNIIKPGDIIEEKVKVIDIDCYNATSSVGYFYEGIYQTGDASNFPNPGQEVQVLFTACFPDLFSEYIRSCEKIQPELVIPYHYNPEKEEELKAAQDLVDKLEENGFNTRLLQKGQEILL